LEALAKTMNLTEAADEELAQTAFFGFVKKTSGSALRTKK